MFVLYLSLAAVQQKPFKIYDNTLRIVLPRFNKTKMYHHYNI
jgi:hypothetical protein